MKALVIVTAAGFSLFTSCSPTSDNVRLTGEMFDAFNKHDWKKMTEFYAVDALFLDPSLGTDFVKQTHSQTVEKYSGLQSVFPDINDDVTGIYSSGDKVIVEFISTGTSPNGMKLKLPIVSILTFKNGLIIRDATYYDMENP